MDTTRESWLQYKKQLETWNSQGKQPEYTEQEKQTQLQSDARIKGYITRAVESDNTLRKMLGVGLLTNGYIDKNLGEIYFMQEMLKGRI